LLGLSERGLVPFFPISGLGSVGRGPGVASNLKKAKKHMVVQGTDSAFNWAKKYKVKLAFGTDLLLNPDESKNRITD
jgi:hypothetical protein